MRTSTFVLAVVALAGSALLLGAGVLNSGAVRKAGIPHGLADVEGTWVLQRVRGTFESAPPEAIVFTAGSAAGFVRVSDGVRTAEFEVQTPGRFVFTEGQHFEPLLPAGASAVYTMTHLCPPLSSWDHLIFYPDGMPHGPNQRVFVYERD